MHYIRIALAGVSMLALTAPLDAASICPPDAVRVGPVCVDKYEGSVWEIPSANKSLVKRVQQGKATLAELQGGGATQLGCQHPFPASFPDTGDWTAPLYAASVAGTLPTTCLSWFQAEEACAISGKRLVTNQEWQRAAAGTPDPGAVDDAATQCNVGARDPEHPGFFVSALAPTGSRSACVSKWGAFDMIGNAAEWVGDWGERATRCDSWSTDYGAEYGNDLSCWGSNGMFGVPGGIIRGGSFNHDENGGSNAGLFAARLNDPPNYAVGDRGFRCAR